MTHLFSIDLEYPRNESGTILPAQKPLYELISPLLGRLKHYRCTATFFVVGQDIENESKLLEEIIAGGHEIASHTYFHRPLDKVTPEEFTEDLRLQHQLISRMGLPQPVGFRAPIFSLRKTESWVYPILLSHNYLYSSSVLPAHNPMYGWEDYCPNTALPLKELPIPVAGFGNQKIPFSGGVYLRATPLFFLKLLCRRPNYTPPFISYMHPYDFDTHSEKRTMHTNPFFNFLLYYNRASSMKKIEWLLEHFGSISFKQYLSGGE